MYSTARLWSNEFERIVTWAILEDRTPKQLTVCFFSSLQLFELILHIKLTISKPNSDPNPVFNPKPNTDPNP